MGRVDLENLKEQIAMLEEQKNSMKPNMGAIFEYRKKEAEHANRVKDLEDVRLLAHLIRRYSHLHTHTHTHSLSLVRACRNLAFSS
jgi:hypothetical protein